MIQPTPHSTRSAAGAAAASYMTPYTYAQMPQNGVPAGSIPGLAPYQQQGAGASLQEARPR